MPITIPPSRRPSDKSSRYTRSLYPFYESGRLRDAHWLCLMCLRSHWPLNVSTDLECRVKCGYYAGVLIAAGAGESAWYFELAASGKGRSEGEDDP